MMPDPVPGLPLGVVPRKPASTKKLFAARPAAAPATEAAPKPQPIEQPPQKSSKPPDTPRLPRLKRSDLARRWPDIFSAFRPLAIGIDTELQEATGFSRKRVSGALHWYTRDPDYLVTLLAPGARRVHLNGDDAGEVTPENQEQVRQGLIARFGEAMVAALEKKMAPPNEAEALSDGAVS
jgi:hypothetical protein